MKKPTMKMPTMKKFTVNGAMIGAIVGLAIIVVGVVMLCNAPASGNFHKSYEYISSYRFGADFYTEIYAVTKGILDQLNGFSEGIAYSFNAVQSALAGIYRAIAWLIICMGAGMSGFFASKLVKEFTIGGKEKAPVAADAPEEKTEEAAAATAEADMNTAENATEAPTEETSEAQNPMDW